MEKDKIQEILIAKEKSKEIGNFFGADALKTDKITSLSNKNNFFDLDIENKKTVTTKKRTRKKTVIETPNYDFIETNSDGEDKTDLKENRKKKYKQSKFRLKLACCVYGILTLLTLGWVVGNGIYINNITNSIQQTKYEINSIQLIIKEAQLDGYEDVQSGNPTLITTVIDIETPPLVQPTKIQPQTNWFDKFCNWVSSLFGG